MTLQNRIFFVLGIPIVFIFLIKLLSFSNVMVVPETRGTKEPEHSYRVYALPLPENLNFAGEAVPLHNFEVRERFDRELLVNSYWQSQTILFFKRAYRWFPLIEKTLREENIPDDFKYLALIESGLMDVVSPAGATGFWQILQSTGRELGLEINNEVDERYHVEKATRAASKFLRSAYESYNSWTLAAASYNMGRSGLNRQLSEQLLTNYYDLWLNEETSRYVFRILAIKTIFENPGLHGFNFTEEDLYLPFDYYTVKVDTTVTDLVAFASQHQVTYKELRTLNPWLRNRQLSNSSRKVYEIKIPKESLFGYEYPVPARMQSPVEEIISPGNESDL
ncbi:MAG: lytic transglycosylase domain-containing protein [Bacteroidota bacterium]